MRLKDNQRRNVVAFLWLDDDSPLCLPLPFLTNQRPKVNNLSSLAFSFTIGGGRLIQLSHKVTFDLSPLLLVVSTRSWNNVSWRHIMFRQFVYLLWISSVRQLQTAHNRARERPFCLLKRLARIAVNADHRQLLVIPCLLLCALLLHTPRARYKVPSLSLLAVVVFWRRGREGGEGAGQRCDIIGPMECDVTRCVHVCAITSLHQHKSNIKTSWHANSN